jgi:hypothetical protein
MHKPPSIPDRSYPPSDNTNHPSTREGHNMLTVMLNLRGSSGKAFKCRGRQESRNCSSLCFRGAPSRNMDHKGNAASSCEQSYVLEGVLPSKEHFVRCGREGDSPRLVPSVIKRPCADDSDGRNDRAFGYIHTGCSISSCPSRAGIFSKRTHYCLGFLARN